MPTAAPTFQPAVSQEPNALSSYTFTGTGGSNLQWRPSPAFAGTPLQDPARFIKEVEELPNVLPELRTQFVIQTCLQDPAKTWSAVYAYLDWNDFKRHLLQKYNSAPTLFTLEATLLGAQ